MKVGVPEDDQETPGAKAGPVDSEEAQQKSTLSLAKSGAGVAKKRQKLQPFKFLPPDSFGKSKPGMLETSNKSQ